jgi:peptidoglycan/LPS O-acetylase OafA/YrhL
VGSIFDTRREIASLNGLRGICASVVVIAHYDFRDVNELFALTYWHNAAVDIFFCLSGFTMFYVHGIERGHLDYRDFFSRRIARLWPLCFLTLILATPPFLMHAGKASAFVEPFRLVADFVRQALMINSWPLVGSGIEYNGPQWSASVEFFLYVALFPVLHSISVRMKRASPGMLAALAIGLMVISLGAYLLWFDPDLMNGIPKVSSPLAIASLSIRGICGFTAGFLIYYYCLAMKDLKWESSYSDLLSITAIAVIIIASLDYLPYQTLIVLAPAIIVANLAPGSWTHRILSSGLFRYLGTISYSLYLLHVPLIWYLTGVLLRFQKLSGVAVDFEFLPRVLAMILIFPISSLCYAFVEKPARRFVHGLLSPRVRAYQANAQAGE